MAANSWFLLFRRSSILFYNYSLLLFSLCFREVFILFCQACAFFKVLLFNLFKAFIYTLISNSFYMFIFIFLLITASAIFASEPLFYQQIVALGFLTSKYDDKMSCPTIYAISSILAAYGFLICGAV